MGLLWHHWGSWENQIEYFLKQKYKIVRAFVLWLMQWCFQHKFIYQPCKRDCPPKRNFMLPFCFTKNMLAGVSKWNLKKNWFFFTSWVSLLVFSFHARALLLAVALNSKAPKFKLVSRSCIMWRMILSLSANELHSRVVFSVGNYILFALHFFG